MLQHDRMACELPARVEPHAGFRVGEHLDALGIKPVETGVGQDIPMGRLEVVQPVELAVAVEMTDGVRIGLQPLEKITQRKLDAR